MPHSYTHINVLYFAVYLEMKKYEHSIYMTFTIHKHVRLMCGIWNELFGLHWRMYMGDLSQQCSIDGKISLIILKTISDRKSR